MSKQFSPTEMVVAVLFFAYAFTFPLYSSAYQIDNFSNFYVSSILVMSLTILWGFTGVFSFGQTVFYTIGAYTFGIFAKSITAGSTNLLSLVLAIIVCGIIAGILGWFIFYGKISSVFTGLITLCIAKACEIFMTQTSGDQWQILGVQLGGYNGMSSIPEIQIGSFQFEKTSFYFLAVTMTLLVYIGVKFLQRSKWGYCLYSVRENIDRSELFGYDVAKIQTLSFAASGALAGLAGAMFSSWSGYVAPSNFSLTTAVTSIVIVAAAGKKNPTAAVAMTLIYNYFTQSLSSQGSEYTRLILGVVLILVVMFVPDGLIQGLFTKCDKLILHIKEKRATK